MMYENFSENLFHDKYQRKGKIIHQSIDYNKYSTSKRFIIGKEIYSEKYKLMGKIDIYDLKTKTLIERKTKIKKIYLGYIYQLYAQFFCLKEMGFEIKKIILKSLEDNKNFNIPLPEKDDMLNFENLIKEILNFDYSKILNHSCNKCSNSIYSVLNW